MSIKGNLVVGQSGGPTAVINNSLVGVIHEAMQHDDEIGDIYGMLHGISGVLNEEFVDLRRQSAEALETLRMTPASALGTVRYKVTDEDYGRLLDVLKTYDIRYFFYIGGNDSMDTTHKIHQLAVEEGYELQAIGIPKTVDNDLAYTDHCPGYGSAARFVASAIRNTAFDTEAMGPSGPLKLMEVMGRNAGWLTAATALAKTSPEDPPHLIYVPERGVPSEQIVADARGWLERVGYCVIAVSEGLKDEDGLPMGQAKNGKVERDAFGHVRKEGVVEFLAELLKEASGHVVRCDKPGYLQRSFGELISSVDRDEAYRVGRVAVQAAMRGENGKMVTLERLPGPEYAVETGLAPLGRIANVEHLLPDAYINDESNGVTEAFVEYARPLIGGPLARYARLDKTPIPKRP